MSVDYLMEDWERWPTFAEELIMGLGTGESQVMPAGQRNCRLWNDRRNKSLKTWLQGEKNASNIDSSNDIWLNKIGPQPLPWIWPYNPSKGISECRVKIVDFCSGQRPPHTLTKLHFHSFKSYLHTSDNILWTEPTAKIGNFTQARRNINLKTWMSHSDQ